MTNNALDFYASILDNVNMITTDLVQTNWLHGSDTDKDLYKYNSRSYSFLDAIDRINDERKFDFTFFTPFDRNIAYKATIIGRGYLPETAIDNSDLMSKFKSLFKILDSKTTVFFYVDEFKDLKIKCCVTVFRPKPSFLDKEMTVYWDYESVDYMSKFVQKEMDKHFGFGHIQCDIYVDGGILYNVVVSPKNPMYDYQDNEKNIRTVFSGNPFCFDARYEFEEGQSHFITIDYRQIMTIRDDFEANTLALFVPDKYRNIEGGRIK